MAESPGFEAQRTVNQPLTTTRQCGEEGGQVLFNTGQPLGLPTDPLCRWWTNPDTAGPSADTGSPQNSPRVAGAFGQLGRTVGTRKSGGAGPCEDGAEIRFKRAFPEPAATSHHLCAWPSFHSLLTLVLSELPKIGANDGHFDQPQLAEVFLRYLDE